MIGSAIHSDTEEILETLRMVEFEHLDIRTTTLGLSLLDIAGSDSGLPERIYRRLTERGANLVQIAKEVGDDLGVPIVNQRISVTPIALIAGAADREMILDIARALDQAGTDVGVDYVAGFSALVHKGATTTDEVFIKTLPEAINATTRLTSSINVATTKAGINMDAVAQMGHLVKELAERSADQGGLACSRFVCFANAVEDNPFIAGAFHGVGEPDAVINVGISGPGVVNHAVRRLMKNPPPGGVTIGNVSETIKRMAFKVTRAGELIGRVVAARMGDPVRFGVVDLSLAPTPAEGDSVSDILEAMGLERTGAHGTTAALMLLTDAVKKGGAMASSNVGGLSGAFIPVSEDRGMIDAVRVGALSIDKLEAMTAVCSVGLDMVAIPGDTPAATISGIIADQMAIGVVNHKTTAARLIPVPGKVPGDVVEYGGLLGDAIVMPVSKFSSQGMIDLGGRIPAPLQSMKN